VEPAPLVVCITDFGSEDFYAGALRGVLAGLLPRGSVVDVTHRIPAGDIRRAALVLWEAQPSFPKGTVFLVVVDPGVGGDRRAAAFRFSDCAVVCPDNGIVTFLLERSPEYQAAELDPSKLGAGTLSNTFHGRDLFAPAAARLASGTPLSFFGPALSSPARLPLPRFQGDEAAGWSGEVLYSDHFGNIITSIGRISYDFRALSPWIRTGARGGTIPPNSHVELDDGSCITIGKTYSNLHGDARRIAVVGSNGLLEIASRPSAAGTEPALTPGSGIRLIPPS
jgi:S-adenosylmethionine hydrolase